MVEEHLVQVEEDAEPRAVRFPGVVPVIPGAEGKTRWVGPELGEHTVDVLQEVAGYSRDEAEALAAGTDREAVHVH